MWNDPNYKERRFGGYKHGVGEVYGRSLRKKQDKNEIYLCLGSLSITLVLSQLSPWISLLN